MTRYKNVYCTIEVVNGQLHPLAYWYHDDCKFVCCHPMLQSIQIGDIGSISDDYRFLENAKYDTETETLIGISDVTMEDVNSKLSNKRIDDIVKVTSKLFFTLYRRWIDSKRLEHYESYKSLDGCNYKEDTIYDRKAFRTALRKLLKQNRYTKEMYYYNPPGNVNGPISGPVIDLVTEEAGIVQDMATNVPLVIFIEDDYFLYKAIGTGSSYGSFVKAEYGTDVLQ